MKSLISKTMALLALGIGLLAFTSKPGGEGFEIYLNNKVVLQQFGDLNTVKSLTLMQNTPEDKMVIKYHHCGRVGKNRVISIKDAQNNTLKEFHYKDGTSPVAAMEVKVKDIVNLKKTQYLKLYYRSTELPQGRMLVSLNTSGNNLTKL